MTMTDVAPSWSLTEHARAQLTECGISLSEVYRVLRQPQTMMPAPEGGFKYCGYGLVVVIENGTEITSIILDGASADTWEGWAVERAEFGDSDVATADALVAAELVPAQREDPPAERRARRRTRAVPAPRLNTSHILDAIHPALRAEITHQVAGDFTRLIVHSSTNVSILPLS
jgi:hypothetical protein